ncbi:hypothetical protein ACH5RR_008464 [Cinchona calisaya]|uniref:DUF4283 domain-containing protein n=1 Tax=Cinchona calisaya TaxID=153742 RepID=A0ABD3AF92_9GENT
MSIEKEDFTIVPIWIRFPKLKFHYYTGKSLSKLASYVGKSLYVDKLTASQSRLSFARVCVEVAVTSKFPIEIPIINEFHEKEMIPIKYEWTPPSAQIVMFLVMLPKTVLKTRRNRKADSNGFQKIGKSG